MKKIFIGMALSLTIAVSLSYAGEFCEVRLEDGTKILGEVVSLQDGIYEMKTQTMGAVEVDAGKVILIRKVERETPAIQPMTNSTQNNTAPEPETVDADAENAEVNPQMIEGGIDAIKQAMQSNPQAMDSIASLQNDPDFQAVLNDPEIMDAVNSNDIEALSSNPKFLRLLENSTVEDISGELQQ